MATLEPAINGIDDGKNGDGDFSADLVPVPALEEPSADEAGLLSDVDAVVEASGDDEAGKVSGFAATSAPDGAAVKDMAQELTVKRHEFYYIRIPRPDLTAEITEIKAVEQKFREKREKQQFISAALRIKRVWSRFRRSTTRCFSPVARCMTAASFAYEHAASACQRHVTP